MRKPGGGRFNLGTKFMLLTSSLVLITSFVIGLFMIKDARENYHELLIDHGRSFALMIARNSEDGIYREDTDSLRSIVELIGSDPAIAYIFILNQDKRVLLYKTAEDFPIHIPAMPDPPLNQDSRIQHLSFYNKENGKHYVNIMAPVFKMASKSVKSAAASSKRGKGPVLGYIHVGISEEGIRSRIRQFIYSILLFTSLIIVTGVILAVLIARRIVAPINDLNRATREIAEGKLNRQIQIHTNDEVSDLARAFNHMLIQLQLSQQKVERHTTELTAALKRMRQEISERKRTENALKESEKKYRMIFEESKDVIFICGYDGRFLDINPVGAELFGYASADSLRAVNLQQDLFDNAEEFEILLRLLERHGSVKDHEVTLKRNNGEKLTVLVTASPIRENSGGGRAFRGVFHDVTDKRRLEQQLIQAQKMEAIGQLAGGIAHDFNNILTAIMGYANLLLMDMDEENRLKDHAEHILSSSERAANLTRSLLAFSRKQVISPKPVNLNSIVTTIERLLVRLIGEDILLKTELDEEEIMILADSGQIEQVLINLCTNSRDAMPEGGVLTIATSTLIVREQSADFPGVDRPGPYAVLAVSDTGSGIDESIKQKIFEPFFTTKETGKGTGLGLSIVYGIIEQHNGFIHVSADGTAGTVFKILFPLIGSRSDSQVPRPAVMPRGGTETILVAEDDPEVRKLIRLVLGGNGYRVIEAVDGQDALATLSGNNHTIHLMLLDVIMPKKNGKEVYDAVKCLQPGIKTVFMSGYTADILGKKGMIEKNLNFLSKPIAPLELLTIVRTVLDVS